jgi:hypothetical protein
MDEIDRIEKLPSAMGKVKIPGVFSSPDQFTGMMSA